jgi:hypothetical protein
MRLSSKDVGSLTSKTPAKGGASEAIIDPQDGDGRLISPPRRKSSIKGGLAVDLSESFSSVESAFPAPVLHGDGTIIGLHMSFSTPSLNYGSHSSNGFRRRASHRSSISSASSFESSLHEENQDDLDADEFEGDDIDAGDVNDGHGGEQPDGIHLSSRFHDTSKQGRRGSQIGDHSAHSLLSFLSLDEIDETEEITGRDAAIKQTNPAPSCSFVTDVEDAHDDGKNDDDSTVITTASDDHDFARVLSLVRENSLQRMGEKSRLVKTTPRN